MSDRSNLPPEGPAGADALRLREQLRQCAVALRETQRERDQLRAMLSTARTYVRMWALVLARIDALLARVETR
ncbi:MAG: hypothetical protein M3O50_18315 [Myxococcota bacterium]|jgi:hypothetical protein|nr:hypothetical protein [Myxococcota bacterium]